MTEAIERLKDRQKRKVSARNPSLNSQAKNDSIAEDSQLLNQSSNDNCLTANNQVVKQLNSNSSITENSQLVNESEINDSLTESNQLVTQSNNNDSLTESSQSVGLKAEPMRRTIRLDPAVDKLMDTLCRENRVTRETLIEAAILTCSKNQKTLNKAIVEAKDRYKNRKRIGELKKLQTMNRKFGRDIS